MKRFLELLIKLFSFLIMCLVVPLVVPLGFFWRGIECGFNKGVTEWESLFDDK